MPSLMASAPTLWRRHEVLHVQGRRPLTLCRYQAYERKLEELRQVRRKLRKISGKRSLADYGIVRRIHFIYERATRKFKGDLTVWMAWLDFCKESRSVKQVSKVVTSALKLHPAAPFLWTYAAAWYAPAHTPPCHAVLCSHTTRGALRPLDVGWLCVSSSALGNVTCCVCLVMLCHMF